MFPFGGQLEQMGRQNIEMLEQAMRMFAPFEGFNPQSDSAPKAAEDSGAADMKLLQQQLDALQAQLNKMTGDN